MVNLTDFFEKQTIEVLQGDLLSPMLFFSIPGRPGNTLAQELVSGHRNRSNEHFPAFMYKRFRYNK